MKKIYLICILVVPLFASAQYVPQQNGSTNDSGQSENSTVDFGIGAGLDYGGLGGSFTVFPDKHFGIFGGVGYAVAGAGYNVGAKIKFNPESKGCFTMGGMYGYNAAIKVTGAPQYDKVYYGGSFFFGVDIRARRMAKNYTSIELLIPSRSQAFKDDLNSLKNNGAVTGLKDPWPVLFSIGYHIGF